MNSIRDLFFYSFFLLQPAVEAFFLVHAPPSTERERERSSSSANRANPAVDLVPEVPAPQVTAQPQTPGQAGAEAGAANVPAAAAANPSGEEASPASMALENAPPAPTLTPDQQKFLKFAGK